MDDETCLFRDVRSGIRKSNRVLINKHILESKSTI